MAHSHAQGAPEGTYLLDQVCTVAASLGLGLSAVWLYQAGTLRYILVPGFWKPVAIGGVLVALLSVVRLIALVRLTMLARAETPGQEAEHVHDENCGHDQSHDHSHSHSHSHAAPAVDEDAHDHGDDDHDHGWAPWRYIVLALPIVLVLLKIPNDGFSADRWNKELAGGAIAVQRVSITTVGAVAGAPWVLTRKSDPKSVMFNELTIVAASAQARAQYTGKFVRLTGQFFPYDDRNFTLYRLKISCCASDAVPLKVRIACDFVVSNANKGDWVEVIGEVQFVKSPDKENEWTPVMIIQELKDIKPIEKPLELYESV